MAVRLDGVLLVPTALTFLWFPVQTSADSGSLVVAMLSSGGDPEPARWLRVLWASLGGVVAAALLVVGGGGLGALQTAAIITALPFSVVMIGMALGPTKALRGEHHAKLRRHERELTAEITEEVGASLGVAPDDHRTSTRRPGGTAAD